MEAAISRPIKEYKQAFMEFADANESDFQIKEEGIVLALYEDRTYRICHYNDLLWEFKTYFKGDLSLIYTETPFELWKELFDGRPEITQENLIIDIYNAWKLYWEQEQPQFSNRQTWKVSREQSWEDTSFLIEKLKSGPANIFEYGVERSDINLIPILALAMRMQFKSENDFYRTCVDSLIEQFPEEFSSDGNFDEIKIDTGKTIQRFFIYLADYNFNDNITGSY